MKPRRVWSTAVALYSLRVAAGLKPKPVKYPGRIAWIREDTLARLKARVAALAAFVPVTDEQLEDGPSLEAYLQTPRRRRRCSTP